MMRLPNGMEIRYLDRREAEFIYQEIFCAEKYLAHGLCLPDHAVVVDVGANIGLFSLYVKQRVPGARVFALEPVAEIAEVLRTNLQDQPSCRVLPVGLSSADGSAELTYFPRSPGMSSRYADLEYDSRLLRTALGNAKLKGGPFLESIIRHKLHGRPVCCSVRRLSSVLDEEGIREIDLLKIDVEKSESDVLAGIDSRHWPGIRQIVVEVHDRENRLTLLSDELRCRRYSVAVEQDVVFRGTGVYLVYAKRETPR
jgi:FkbM family methyltransferase